MFAQDPAVTAGSPRALRRQATVRRILEAAWALSRERGLTGWTLRDLGAEVGMRAPSLYVYAESKNALFDLMFADGYRQLAERIAATDRPDDPTALLETAARLYVTFAAEEPVRFQLLFQFTAPGFAPSQESMELAGRALGDLVGGARCGGRGRPGRGGPVDRRPHRVGVATGGQRPRGRSLAALGRHGRGPTPGFALRACDAPRMWLKVVVPLVALAYVAYRAAVALEIHRAKRRGDDGAGRGPEAARVRAQSLPLRERGSC